MVSASLHIAKLDIVGTLVCLVLRREVAYTLASQQHTWKHEQEFKNIRNLYDDPTVGTVLPVLDLPLYHYGFTITFISFENPVFLLLYIHLMDVLRQMHNENC